MPACVLTRALALLPNWCHSEGMFIAVVNQKGGVGKTTLAVHLAVWLEEHGRHVALIDTDEQRTASDWIAHAAGGVATIIEHEADELIERASQLTAEHDVVLADGPANLAECTRALLLVADVAVIPCGATLPELESTAATVRMLRNAQAVRGGHLPVPLLVLTRMRPWRYRLSREALEAAQAFGIPVARHVIPAREALADSPGQRTAVWHLGPRARAATNELALSLEEIVTYVQESTEYAGCANGRAAGILTPAAKPTSGPNSDILFA